MGTLLVIPIVLAALLLAAALRHWFGLELETKIRFSDFFSVACTAYLAVVLQYLIAQRTSADKDRKEEISGALNEMDASLKAARDRVSEGIGLPDLSSHHQKITHAFNIIFDDLSTLSLKLETCGFTEHQLLVDPIYSAVLEAKSSVTGGNFPQAQMTLADVEAVSRARRSVLRAGELIKRDVAKTHASLTPEWWNKLKARVALEKQQLEADGF